MENLFHPEMINRRLVKLIWRQSVDALPVPDVIWYFYHLWLHHNCSHLNWIIANISIRHCFYKRLFFNQFYIKSTQNQKYNTEKFYAIFSNLLISILYIIYYFLTQAIFAKLIKFQCFLNILNSLWFFIVLNRINSDNILYKL